MTEGKTKLSKNFDLSEFLSTGFSAYRDENCNPSPQVVERLRALCANVLQPVRDVWGEPLTISSGYRCPLLNFAVGGVANSAHLIGAGADVIPANRKDFDRFVRVVRVWALAHRRDFDQIIIEKSGSSRWVHFGLVNFKGEKRGQVFDLNL